MRAPPSTSERAESVSDGSSRRLRFRLVRRLCLLLTLLGLTVAAGVTARPHLRAWYHRRIARDEVQRYHTPQAIRQLRICRDIWPRDPECLLLAARAARRARIYGDTERLLRLYREVRGRDEAHTFEQLLLAAECRVNEVADLCWSHVENDHADTTLILEALTRGYLRQYQLREARRCLERWRQLQPDNPQAWYLDGLFRLDYLQLDRAGALDSYRRALELDEDHEEARLGLAVALLKGRNFAEASEHFQRLRQGQPENLRLQVALAECLDGLGQSAEAVRLADDVLAQQPEFGPALGLRGQLAFASGQWDDAKSWLRRALLHNPQDHRARYSLILCLEQSGQDEEAKRQRRQLQQLEEDLAHFNEIVTRDIAQRPTDPALHCTLGQLLLRGGQREEGMRWLRSALRLDPDYAPARQTLAEYQSQAKGKGTPSSP